MKRVIIIFIVMSIIITTALVAVSMNITNKISINKPDVMQKVQAYPVCFLLDRDIKYNTMLPFINEIDSFTMNESVAIFSPESIQALYINRADISSVSYQIIDPLNKIAIKEQDVNDNNIIPYDRGYKVSIAIQNLDENKRYILKLLLYTQGELVYYYQSFLISSKEQGDVLSTVINAHEEMFNKSNNYKKYINGDDTGGSFYNADENSSKDVLLWRTSTSLVKMNEPIPIITDYDLKSNTYNIYLKFIVANRDDYDFEYWDFAEYYNCNLVDNKVVINSYFRKGHRKNEPYYDQDSLSWVIDEGYMQEEKQQLTSDNGLMSAFIYGNEVYIIDRKYNTLKKVFGFDKLDSDYSMDEDNHHGIKLLALNDKGTLTYMVYGYMASGENVGHNGLAVITFNASKNTNEERAFLNLPYTFENLDGYFDKAVYFNQLYEQLYWLMDDYIYKLNLKNKTLENVMNLSGYTYFINEGVIYSVNDLTKENSAVKVMDLTGQEIISNILIYKGKQVRVLGTIKGQLVIGTYNVENTYEYLNGDVFYPYNSIKIVDFHGIISKTFEPVTETYFGDITVNKEAGIIEFYNYKLNRKVSSAIYIKTNQQRIEQIEIPKEDKQEQLLISSVVEGINKIYINQVGVSLDEDNVTVAKDINYRNIISGNIMQLNTVYEIYGQVKLIDVTNRFSEALIKAKEQKNTLIFEKTDNGKRRLLYDASNTVTSILNEVPIMAQRPELIRGCEVTSLAMFLSYYTGNKVEKTDLANRLRKDETPMSIVDGIINFGDMHKGFVGSIDDNSNPGLGVYIEPLYDVAKNYIDDVYNITGCSFDEVLNFVGRGMPVVVITPINYKAASKSYIKEWKTASGYMEVSYQEHSVVIVGYDENYIYLNDPDLGKLIKKPINAFKAGWISQGRQALVVGA